MTKITINKIFKIIGVFGLLAILLRIMSGDLEGGIIAWGNSQIPFWVTLPAGLIAFGLIVYGLFKKQINQAMNSDLSELFYH